MRTWCTHRNSGGFLHVLRRRISTSIIYLFTPPHRGLTHTASGPVELDAANSTIPVKTKLIAAACDVWTDSSQSGCVVKNCSAISALVYPRTDSKLTMPNYYHLGPIAIICMCLVLYLALHSRELKITTVLALFTSARHEDDCRSRIKVCSSNSVLDISMTYRWRSSRRMCVRAYPLAHAVTAFRGPGSMPTGAEPFV
ncbi:hypothetical protein CPB85DRAFT_902856 [Mucidula mucida]|nr:hypothetical protein CPB85DRAFT_902856 [Mucidula mucida]